MESYSLQQKLNSLSDLFQRFGFLGGEQFGVCFTYLHLANVIMYNMLYGFIMHTAITALYRVVQIRL